LPDRGLVPERRDMSEKRVTINGKEFFAKVAAAFPGFLGRFYGAPPYSTVRDEEVAQRLAPFALACGCPRLSGEMVGKARQAAGLVAIARRPPLPVPSSVPVPAIQTAPDLPLAPPPGQEVADKLHRMMNGIFGRLDAINENLQGIGQRVEVLEKTSRVPVHEGPTVELTLDQMPHQGEGVGRVS
jgi:hypothetical protein